MAKNILMLGNAWCPSRFWNYVNPEKLSEQEINSLKQQGWIERNLSDKEELYMRDSGCLGDLTGAFSGYN